MLRKLLSRFVSLGLAPRLVALAVVVASLAGGSVALSVISSARTTLRNEILDTHQIMADMVSDEIAGYVKDILNDAIDLADRPDVRLAFAFNDFTYMDQQLVRWQALRHSKVDGMAVYSKDAVMLATGRSNRMLVGTSGSINDATIQRVAATGLAARGTPLRSRTTGHPIMPIYVPVRSEAGQIVGVFAETLALESLADSLAKLHFTAHSRVSVTDNVSRLILVSDDRDKVLTTQSSGKNAAANRTRAGERGTMETVRSDGEAALAAFSPVTELSWGVLLQEPSAEAFASIEAMTRQALIWVAAAMVFAALVATGLAISMVRPLRTLRATAERMASGDLGRRTGVRRGDEIGDLGHAFDRMAEQLQDSVEELTRQALSDNLTALPNRVLLHQRLERPLSRSYRFHNGRSLKKDCSTAAFSSR